MPKGVQSSGQRAANLAGPVQRYVEPALLVLSIVTPALAAVKTLKGLTTGLFTPVNPVAPPLAPTLEEKKSNWKARCIVVVCIIAALALAKHQGVKYLQFKDQLHYDLVFNQATHGAKFLERNISFFEWVVRLVVSRVPSISKCSTVAMMVAATVAAVLAGSNVLDSASSPIGAVYTTRFISDRLVKPLLSSSQQRQVFSNTPLVTGYISTNHTHGVSAQARNTASATAGLLAGLLGLEPYYIQQSLTDVRKRRKGDRSYHWAKDIAVPMKEFTFDPMKEAAVLVDVDHYINMPLLLAKYPGTYFVCTFQPTQTAISEGEYTFRFLPTNEVTYRVSGGAEYTHHVWDYSGDTIIVADVGLLTKRVCAYHIDRKRVDDHHVIVMLTLLGQFTIPSVIPTYLLIAGKQLDRLRPVYGPYVVLDVIRETGLYRSVSITGDFTSVTAPRASFDAVHAVALVAKVPMTPAMVASNIAATSPAGLPTERLPPGHAAIIAGYIRSGTPLFPPVVYPPSQSILPIRFDKHDYNAPVPLTGFGSPLINPCYGMVTSIASDDRCITGRVENFQREGEEEEPIPPTLAGYMQEFAEFLIPYPHEGHPVDDDEVRERQDRPSQRNLVEDASVTGEFYKRAWNCFVKKETYPKPTDPRNISVAAPATKLKYSRYQYAFGNEIMHEVRWYAFNKPPVDIAHEVTAILKTALWATLADGSRFDGHVSRRARILERIVMLRFFARQYHSGLNEAMDEQIGVNGSTECGRKYNSGYGRGSGSLETSNLNSVLSAFIGYCAHRNTLVNGVKKTAEEAWEALGMYGGDDSIEGDVDPKALEKSSRAMGQDYEITTFTRGSMGINFLNRFYGPEVWNGDPNSIANPKRLLAKLWVGPASLTDVKTRLGERLSGYYRMDRNSPVIGRICRAASTHLGDFEDGELMPWDGMHPEDTNWPNVDESGWMMDMFNTFIPDFDHDRFNQWIDCINETGDTDLFLQAPMCTDPSTPIAVKIDSIVGDELYQVDAKETKTWGQQMEEEAALAAADPDPIADLEAAMVEATKPNQDVLREASRAVPIPKALAAKANKPKAKAAFKSDNPKHPMNWPVPAQKPGQPKAAYAKFVENFEK